MELSRVIRSRPEDDVRGGGKMKLASFVAIAMALAPAASFAKDKAPPPEPASPPDWAELAAKARTALLENLVDPASAQITWSSGFKWGYAKPGFVRRTYGWIACGTRNAKNRMGGYVGAKPFWVMIDANGTTSHGERESSMTSCDSPPVPVNPELVNVTPASPTPAVSIADELAKLAGLREKGLLTEAEFAAQKAKLLAR